MYTYNVHVTLLFNVIEATQCGINSSWSKCLWTTQSIFEVNPVLCKIIYIYYIFLVIIFIIPVIRFFNFHFYSLVLCYVNYKRHWLTPSAGTMLYIQMCLE